MIFLIDLFIVTLRSDPAEIVISDNNCADIEEQQESDLSNYQKIEQGQQVFIPILNFHHIKAAPAGLSNTDQSYYIEPAEFEQILQDLIDNDYQAVFVSEIVELLEQGYQPPDNWIALTFDDGNINFYTNAFPLLQKYNLKSSQYIMTGAGGENYMSHEQVKEVYDSGLVEIGSHTVFHPYLTRESADVQTKELTKSKYVLEELLGTEINVLSYPFGLYDQDIKDLAQEIGYKAGLTYDQEAWHDPGDLMQLNRISVWPGMDVVSYLQKLK